MELEKLKKMLTDGEAIYMIERIADRPIYVIGPETDDIEHVLDIAGCIEETLHSLLDEAANEEEAEDIVKEILDADKLLTSDYDDENGDYYIDRDYVIYDFYPVNVIATGIVYERPHSTYTAHCKQTVLCKHLDIPEDATDDEVLYIMKDSFAINPDEFIVKDMMNDGSMYGVQSLVDENLIFILKKNSEPPASIIAA